MQSNYDELVNGARDRLKPYTAFWIFVGFSSLLALAEPLLIGVLGFGKGSSLQISLLAVSTIVNLILLFATFSFVKKTVPFFVKLRCIFDSGNALEVICLLIGWIFIIPNPGIAALRCFRVYRTLWYFELVDKETKKDPNYRPEEHMVSISRVCHICMRYLEAVGCELMTAKSKGGLVILIFYFYVTYVFAVMFWIHDNQLATPQDMNPTTGTDMLCESLTGCYITMLRLTLYDGVGLDYLGQVIATRSALMSTLLILYLCFATMILLNGLIGVFGSAFEISEDNGAVTVADGTGLPPPEQEDGPRTCVDARRIEEAIDRLVSEMARLQTGLRREIDSLAAAVDALHLDRAPTEPVPAEREEVPAALGRSVAKAAELPDGHQAAADDEEDRYADGNNGSGPADSEPAAGTAQTKWTAAPSARRRDSPAAAPASSSSAAAAVTAAVAPAHRNGRPEPGDSWLSGGGGGGGGGGGVKGNRAPASLEPLAGRADGGRRRR